MQQSSQPSGSLREEVDLYEVCLVLKKRIWLLFTIVAVSVIVATVVVFTMRPVYRAQMVVQVPQLSDSILPDYAASDIDRLKVLLKEDRVADLTKLLGVSEQTVKSIAAITYNLPKSKKNFLKITLDVYQTETIEKLAEAIVKYLNDNPYVKEALNVERLSLQALKKDIQADVESLNSFRALLMSQIKKGRLREVGFNIAEIDREIMEIKQRLNEIQKQLLLLKGYEMVVRPVIPTKPFKPKKITILALTFISSLFLAVFLVVFIESIERHKARRQLH